MNAEEWPRWLPSPYLRDRYTHWVAQRGAISACGQSTMWAEVGHPTTERPRCGECQRIVGPAAHA